MTRIRKPMYLLKQPVILSKSNILPGKSNENGLSQFSFAVNTMQKISGIGTLIWYSFNVPLKRKDKLDPLPNSEMKRESSLRGRHIANL